MKYLKELIVGEVFSNKEKIAILENIFEKGITDAAFLYKGNGGDFYDKISKSDSYCVYKKELQLIDTYRKKFQTYITKYLTDVGCGNGEKAIHFLSGYTDIGKIIYIASDYSCRMIDIAEKNILQQIPNIKLGNHQILREGNELFTNKLNNNTYLRLGCTIGNFSDADVVAQLKNMDNNSALKGTFIVMSYFDPPQTPQDIILTKQLYDNKEARDFVFNGLSNLGLDPKYFDYIVDYNKETHCVYVGILAKQDLSIRIEDRIFSIQKGKFYPLERSKRFSHTELQKILRQSGAKVQYHVSEHGISLVVVKKDPKHYDKMLKIVFGIGSAISLILSGGIGGYYLSKHNNNQEKNQMQDKLLEKTFRSQGVFPEQTTLYLNQINNADCLQAQIDVSYDVFLKIYGSEKRVSESIIKSLIKNELLGVSKNGKVRCIDFDDIPNYELSPSCFLPDKCFLIVQKMVSKHKFLLNDLGYNPVPYNRFKQYDKEFLETLKITGNIICDDSFGIINNTTDIDFSFLSTLHSSDYVFNQSTSERFFFKNIGFYYDYNHKCIYHFLRLQLGDGSHIFLASKRDMSSSISSLKEVFSLDVAQEGIEHLMSHRL